jgi:hypothetical protein
MQEVYATKIENGSKIYCEGQKHAYKLEENLNKIGVETRVECNEVGMWSIYVVSVPENLIK